MVTNLTLQTLRRLPKYLNYLKSLPKDGTLNISAAAIARALNLNAVSVRKDLDAISDGGKPKIGYDMQYLIADLEKALGYDNVNNAVLVGVGKLGNALLSYEGFSEYGLHILAGFDVDEGVIGTEINGRKILPLEKMQDLCRRMNIQVGIIAVPTCRAQAVCDALAESGVSAIWNFSSAHLNAPENVLVQDENMAATLAALSRRLLEKVSQ